MEIVGVSQVSAVIPHGNSDGIDNRARVKSLKTEGKSVKEIMEATGLKKPTVYAYLRPDVAKPKAKAVKAKGAASPKGADASLTVTPTSNGGFLVKVPADKLSAVAKALAA